MRKPVRFFFLVAIGFAVLLPGWSQDSKFALDLDRWAAENKTLIRTVNNGSISTAGPRRTKPLSVPSTMAPGPRTPATRPATKSWRICSASPAKPRLR